VNNTMNVQVPKDSWRFFEWMADWRFLPPWGCAGNGVATAELPKTSCKNRGQPQNMYTRIVGVASDIRTGDPHKGYRIRYCLKKLDPRVIYPVEFKMNFVLRKNFCLGNYGNGSAVKGRDT
jgi:hypothetical protein